MCRVAGPLSPRVGVCFRPINRVIPRAQVLLGELNKSCSNGSPVRVCLLFVRCFSYSVYPIDNDCQAFHVLLVLVADGFAGWLLYVVQKEVVRNKAVVVKLTACGLRQALVATYFDCCCNA